MEQQTKNLLKVVDNKDKKQETITVNFKSFWGRLFCKHKTTELGDLIIFPSYGSDIPSHKYWRFICTKCGKIKKYKQF